MQQPEVQLFENPLPITFIGGSLWPADEKHLFPALLRIFKEHDNLQLLLVPHELHESHIQAIEQTFRQEGIETQRYTDFANTGNGKTTCRVAIINTIGMLAKLYKNTDIAYVGGAFPLAFTMLQNRQHLQIQYYLDQSTSIPMRHYN